MALVVTHDSVKFGIGDTVKVYFRLPQSDTSTKGSNTQVFEGVVIAIKGRLESKTITVRRIGVQQVGIEKIFPLSSPLLTKVEVVRSGVKGTRRAKLYYVRSKHKREVELIYTRANRKGVKAKSKSNSSKKQPRKRG